MQDVDDCLAYVKNIYSELIKFMGKENVPPEKTVISYCGKVKLANFSKKKLSYFSVFGECFQYYRHLRINRIRNRTLYWVSYSL